LDSVYPKFIKNSGQRTKEWIVALFNDILTSGKNYETVQARQNFYDLKPGKDGSDPSLFRPISLLSIVFKILDLVILQRTQPLIDAVVPVSQAGYSKNCSCTEQVLALKSLIEAGFQGKLETGVVFIDLTPAYDTVWRDGLML
jgi:hypothetical protein